MNEKERLQKAGEETTAKLESLIFEDQADQSLSNQSAEFEKVLAALPSEFVFDSRAKRALRDYRRKKSREAVRRHFRAVMVAAALFVSLVCITYASYQEDIHNFIMTITDKYFTIGSQSVDDSKYFDLTGLYVPQYIPEDYHLVRNPKTSDYIALEYEGRDETESICFQQAIGDAGFMIDADSETNIVPIRVQDTLGEAAFYSDGTIIIYWGQRRQFLIRGTVSSSELLKIAESVVFVPK